MLISIYFTDIERSQVKKLHVKWSLSPKKLCMHIFKQVRKTRRKLKMPTALVVLELKRLRQKYCKFEVSLSITVRSCFKERTTLTTKTHLKCQQYRLLTSTFRLLNMKWFHVALSTQNRFLGCWDGLAGKCACNTSLTTWV